MENIKVQPKELQIDNNDDGSTLSCCNGYNKISVTS